MNAGAAPACATPGWLDVTGRGGKLLIGNWKMNGTQAMLPILTAVATLANQTRDVGVGIAVPHTLIAPAHAAAPSLIIGAQEVHEAVSGAYTGSVSAEMVRDAGARFTILGHSEQRSRSGYTDAALAASILRAADEGLTVVVCCGETADQRARGVAEQAVRESLRSVLPRPLAGTSIVIAYEPVWAIGSGVRPSDEQINAMSDAIRSTLSALYPSEADPIPILYGGSVNAASAGLIGRVVGVDGLLVGTASLSVTSFTQIVDSIGDCCGLQITSALTQANH
ncbi:triose-phosphate isomerase [Sphingomonas sp. Tas61C01]|uniref:triose-phosphate isomerase n=1 Tax=Sphingomonas sp. Tas61C01 TaxID=3458297 RepID=UPI00403E44ED